MDEEIKVGDWVWVWTRQIWGVVVSGCSDNDAWMVKSGGRVFPVHVEHLTTNPVIPPKPKKKVKREGWVLPAAIYYRRVSGPYIKVEYEVEE